MSKHLLPSVLQLEEVAAMPVMPLPTFIQFEAYIRSFHTVDIYCTFVLEQHTARTIKNMFPSQPWPFAGAMMDVPPPLNEAVEVAKDYGMIDPIQTTPLPLVFTETFKTFQENDELLEFQGFLFSGGEYKPYDILELAFIRHAKEGDLYAMHTDRLLSLSQRLQFDSKHKSHAHQNVLALYEANKDRERVQYVDTVKSWNEFYQPE